MAAEICLGETVIPKIIHYCWFGRTPLPKLARKCIRSWRKYLPDYEIREWNEDNFDVHGIPYTKEAYEAGKYAFVSDYARFWILYRYGGVYFDTDVEVIRPLDDIIAKGPFMGFGRDPDERDRERIGLGVNPGLGIASNPGHGLLKELLDLYSSLHYISDDGSHDPRTIVYYTSRLLEGKGLEYRKGIQQVAGMTIYPAEYFSPVHFVTRHLHITKNTRTIHHYAASWKDGGSYWKRKIQKLIPEFILLYRHDKKNRPL